jgi:hypothetical protein
MLIESLPNYQMIDETNLDEPDNESPAQIPFNETINNDSISRHPKCQFHSGQY